MSWIGQPLPPGSSGSRLCWGHRLRLARRRYAKAWSQGQADANCKGRLKHLRSSSDQKAKMGQLELWSRRLERPRRYSVFAVPRTRRRRGAKTQRRKSRGVLSGVSWSFVVCAEATWVSAGPADELWHTQTVTGNLRLRLGIFQEYDRCRGAEG